MDDAARACLAALRLPRAADTLSALFAARVGESGDATFLVAGPRAWTWVEADRASRAWARRLAAEGCRPGDRVAAALPNGDATVLLLLACARMGCVFSPLNPALGPDEYAALWRVLAPAAVIAVPANASAVADGLDRAGMPAALLHADAHAPALRPGPAANGVPADAGDAAPDPDAPLAIVFTSGTTGVPKGAVHSHRTYVAASEIAAWRMRLTGADRMLVVLPLFHLNALFYSVGGAIASGARLVVEERFSASTFWATVRAHGITQVNLIAAVGNILLKRDRAEFGGNATLRKVSAAPVPAHVAAQMNEDFGVTHVVESYGMTEAPGIAQVDFDDTGHRACLGRPIRHPSTGAQVSEIRIVDDARRTLPRGAVGRIMVRSTTMMKGYFNRPDLRDAIDPDGWFLTEDLGSEDDDGHFRFHGRTAERIRCRGENLSASEVEGVLIAHPAIAEAGCIGVPSELGEEDVLAAVVLRPGSRLDPDAFAAYCAAWLAPAKRPRWLVVRDALPRTPTQKFARHRLRAEPDLLAGAIDLGRGRSRGAPC